MVKISHRVVQVEYCAITTGALVDTVARVVQQGNVSTEDGLLMAGALVSHPPAEVPAGLRLVHVPRWLRLTLSVVILSIIVWWVIIPQYSAAVVGLNSLERVSLPLVLLASALEIMSLLGPATSPCCEST